jgi:murein tripeptide amidase MpaA
MEQREQKAKDAKRPVKHLTVAIYAADRRSLGELVRTYSLDYGCRPHAIADATGAYYTTALVSREERDHLISRGLDIRDLFDQTADDRTANATIGKGDRFKGGTVPPQGVGSRPHESASDIGPIMNPDEINSAIQGLANEYGITTIDVPNATAEGSGGKAGMTGKPDPRLYHVYFTAGVHARERGGPDNLIYFIADLLFAQKHSTGLSYGAKTYSKADVIKALNTGIVFFPLVNPDGVWYDQKTDSLWRKNRNPADATPGADATIGVDINRNYDFLWDFRRHFHPAAAAATSLASDKPIDETYHGRCAFSEPETRNVAWVFDQFPRFRWYMDIHSAAGDILFNWGDDNIQLNDPSMQFLNAAWDGKRGIVGDAMYREWIEESDYGKVSNVARRVAGAMHSVGGRTYGPLQAVGLYPTSGASDDYSYSRYRANAKLNKTYGFTMEFGYPTNFYPTLAEYHNNLKDTGAGLMEFCLAAADAGL